MLAPVYLAHKCSIQDEWLECYYNVMEGVELTISASLMILTTTLSNKPIPMEIFPFIYGTEYEHGQLLDHMTMTCPVLFAMLPQGAAKLMIPAKTSCPSGWTREYYGYHHE